MGISIGYIKKYMPRPSALKGNPKFEILLVKIFSLNIVTRSNIVWKLARGYCLCYCKTFSLVPDSAECTKNFFTDVCGTLFAPLKIK